MWGGMNNSVEKVSSWDWRVSLAVQSLHSSPRGPDAVSTVHIKWLSLLITPVPWGPVLFLVSAGFCVRSLNINLHRQTHVQVNKFIFLLFKAKLFKLPMALWLYDAMPTWHRALGNGASLSQTQNIN